MLTDNKNSYSVTLYLSDDVHVSGAERFVLFFEFVNEYNNVLLIIIVNYTSLWNLTFVGV